MDESTLQLVAKIGTQLRRQTRPNKDFLVKSLREAVAAFAKLEQPSGTNKREATRKLEGAVEPLKETIVNGLLKHRDKDVKLLVAICATEIMRLMAPEPPFEDIDLRDVFRLLVNVFAELADTSSSLFSKRAKIVEIVAKLKCCVIMLDIDCNDVVLEMFNTFFSVVREHHQQTLIKDILSIMAEILNEEASPALLDVVLHNLVKEGTETASASSQLAVSVLQSCAEKLEPLVCGFLTSCILDRDAVGSELKEFYHEIIFKIYQNAPQMLLAVIPNLTQELLTDQVDVRIKAVKLIGKLFTLPEHNMSQKYHGVFVEFLKRFSDKSVEVRISALQCVKLCYITKPSGEESQKLLSSLEGRLLDFDDKVRTQAVVVSCDLAISNLRCFPPKLLSQTTERLRDKKIPIRKMALQKLMEVYQYYCTKCSEGYTAISDHFEQIPCKILMLCYDKDCKEFRAQNMELVFAEDLFPAVLSMEERTRHWIHLFSVFSPLHLKALNAILSQKQRLQSEMRSYLEIKKKEKGNDPEDMQNKYKNSFLKMAVCFADPSKTEGCFYKLNQMKDNNIFDSLALLLDESKDARTTRDKFLHIIGEKHENFEFLQTLSSKCSYNIFSSEHVRCILDILPSNTLGNKHLEASCVRLLLAISSFFPTLLRGSETQFQMLLQESNPNNDKLIEVLAQAGRHILVNLREIKPFLEKICLEGSRQQAKYAVSAIAALFDTSKQLSSLCKKLVESLLLEQNIPTVLQSLGCLAQHSVSTFESQSGVITPYIYQQIFQVNSSNYKKSFNDASTCSNSCRLKIYGLKTLVKSFLPHGGSCIKRQVSELWGILSTMLQKGETVDGISSCEVDEACQLCIRLAAAKSVLRLSRKWDFHISPEIFRITISMAKDDSPLVRRVFLDKTHKLLKGHAIPSRYACAFAMASSDCLKDVQDDSFKYITEFIKDYSREAQARQISGAQEGLLTSFPAYIVVFLIHFLAHDKDFPHEDCQDEETYAQFSYPLFVLLRDLVEASVKDTASYLLCIFRAIKNAEDAIDVEKTPLSRLHLLADIGYLTLTNHKGLCSSDGPGQLLLPSSLYKSNSRSLAQSSFDKNFVQRVVNFSNISLLSGNLQKRGRKCQDNNSKPIVIKGNTGINTRHKRKRALSPNAPGSDGNDASKKSESSLGKELVSSCDSVATKSSLDDQNMERNTLPLSENVGVNMSIEEEHCNRPSTHKAEQNKKKKVSVDISVSEVLDKNDNSVAKRTRRQKKLTYG